MTRSPAVVICLKVKRDREVPRGHGRDGTGQGRCRHDRKKFGAIGENACTARWFGDRGVRNRVLLPGTSWVEARAGRLRATVGVRSVGAEGGIRLALCAIAGCATRIRPVRRSNRYAEGNARACDRN